MSDSYFACRRDFNVLEMSVVDIGKSDFRHNTGRHGHNILSQRGQIVFDHAGMKPFSRIANDSILPSDPTTTSAPRAQFSFRGSIPGPHVPLSTLRAHSCPNARMTRGQYGLLLLYCKRLSLSIIHRWAPAHVAVGTVLTDGPPRRSQRAELPHWAPTSGVDAQTLRKAGPAVSVLAHFASPRFRRRDSLLAVSAISRSVPV